MYVYTLYYIYSCIYLYIYRKYDDHEDIDVCFFEIICVYI